MFNKRLIHGSVDILGTLPDDSLSQPWWASPRGLVLNPLLKSVCTTGTSRVFRVREVIPSDEAGKRNPRTYNIPLPHNSVSIHSIFPAFFDLLRLASSLSCMPLPKRSLNTRSRHSPRSTSSDHRFPTLRARMNAPCRQTAGSTSLSGSSARTSLRRAHRAAAVACLPYSGPI